MHRHFLEARRYRRVEYALNAFGARLRHASVRYMCVPFLSNIATACLRGASNV